MDEQIQNQDQLLDEQLDEMLKEQEAQPAEAPVEKKKMARWKKRLLITLLVILAFLTLAVSAGAIYLNYLWGRVGKYDETNDKKVSQSEADKITQDDLVQIEPDEELPDISDVDKPQGDAPVVNKNKDVINILVVGQDSDNIKYRTRTDTMILISIQTKAQKVTLTSFMRDAYVVIPGYKPNKLNHAYQFGGLKLLNETIKVNFGVEVDGNVIINFSSFKKVIDLLDGVDIELTAKEAEYLVNGCKHDVKPGMNRLNGEEAFNYARLREIDNDYRRTNRQRKVILSIINRYKSLPVMDMLALLDDILPVITTNMEKSEVVELVMKYGGMANGASYKTQQIPANGTFKEGNVRVREGLKNWFQYDINFEKNRKILQTIMDGKN